MQDEPLYRPTSDCQMSNETADHPAERGQGGELHQTPKGDTQRMTTAQGTPVSDDQNSLKAGARGPTLMEDLHFREKMFHFDHERIPERVVHARATARTAIWRSPRRSPS